jgi:signal peptidase I
VRHLHARIPQRWRTPLDWLLTIGGAILFVLVFEAEVAKPYRIPSASMETTLHCARPAEGCEASTSDRVLALRLVYRFRDPARGDIAVFKTPRAAAARCGSAEGSTFVKRVIGLPGEVVSERHGYVFVDGKPLHEPYVAAVERDALTQTWARVPAHEYFVMGDNRRDSCDSRTWGPVPRRDFIGPASITYWPPTRISLR